MLTLTRQSFKTIRDESRNRDVETGGILIGTLIDPILIRVGIPGPKAQMSPTHFRPDIQYDRRLLKEEITRFEGRVKFMGYWHKHPRSMPRPSGDDLWQAKKLAEDLGHEAPYFFLIVTVREGVVNIQPYRLKDAQKDLQPVGYRIIPDNSPKVKQALRREPPVILTREGMNLWTHPDFQFYLTRRGKDRLVSEVRELKEAGFQVQVVRDKGSKRASLVVEKSGKRYSILPPVEYPINPPRIFSSGELMDELETLSGWNSDCRLKDVLKEAFQTEKAGQPLPLEIEEVNITLKPRRSHESNHLKRALSKAQKLPGKIKHLWICSGK